MTHLKLKKNMPKETSLAYIRLGFTDSLFSIRNLCDSGMHCIFTPTNVCAYDPNTSVVKLQVWQDSTSMLWHFPICNIQDKNKNKIKQEFKPSF